jgi:twitching motility protein PilT
VDRIIEVFPENQQLQIRSMLADGIRAVIAQSLFKRIDIPGRLACPEILIATHAVRALIRENKSYQIPTAIQTGKKYGMQSLDDAIMGHLKAHRIDPEEAYMKCEDKEKFRPFLRTPPADFTEV